MPRLEEVEDLLGAPERMRSPGGAEQGRHGGRDAVGAVMWGPAAIGEGGAAALGGAGHPLVAGGATDAVAFTKLGHRIEPRVDISDEAFALLHRIGLQPRHGQPPEGQPG